VRDIFIRDLDWCRDRDLNACGIEYPVAAEVKLPSRVGLEVLCNSGRNYAALQLPIAHSEQLTFRSFWMANNWTKLAVMNRTSKAQITDRK